MATTIPMLGESIFATTVVSPEFSLDISEGTRWTTKTESVTVDKTVRMVAYGFESGKTWPTVTDQVKIGTSSYQSYAIGNSQTTYMTATVTGKGSFSFWWKVSSEKSCDYLRYYVDDTEKAKISGTADWAQVTIPVTATGKTVVKWSYTKDGSTSSGSDCGWINGITWTPETVLVEETKAMTYGEGMPGNRRVARPTETILYSSDWQGTEAGSWSCGAVVPAAWKPSAGNVLKGREPVHVGTRYEETDHVSAADPLSRLTNGRVNEAGESWDDTVAFKDGTLTWALTEPTDLTLLRVNTHWKDGGRDGISFSAVEYQVAGDDGWYELSGSQVCFGVKGQDAEDNEGGPDLEAVYRASNGRVVAQNVVAIRFVLGPQDNSGTGYTEFEAVGTPSSARHAVVNVYPCLKEKPKYIAIDLSGGTNATRYPIEYLDEIPGGSWSDEYKTSKLVLRHIPAGSFIMGGRNTDYPGAVNANLHMVTLTRDFYMGVFEVTQRQWELVMGNRPSCFTNEMCYATRPVDSVNYAMIRGTDLGSLWPESAVVDEGSFIGIMRRKTSVGLFDLPTEAQWEYACRAGTTTALSSGRDLTVNDKNSDSLDVARSANNGGVDWEVTLWAAQHSDATDEIGTAKVGSYAPNGFGLYDCHGNVFEVCLDRFQDSQEGCVDPVGPTRTVGPVHVMRGGSWINNAGGLRSAHRESDALRTSPAILGLRLCLQGGEVCGPDAQTLVEAAGSATVIWTPTRAGTYCLTHQVQKDGASLGAEYSALFEVNGPTLSLSANGELEPGVGIEVKVKGEGEQWNVYYTLDGSEPTSSSTVYSGAITLNETTTVRAVAINAQGVRSEEALATFTLHDALGIASAVAIPRYPWNGKVDVDVELKGNPEAQYLVELVARDLVGGTNLSVRTVYRDAALIPNPCTLIPAKHRLVWDAAADIAGDYDFARVVVTVKATGSHLLAYPKTLKLTVNGYTGTETLADVPTLVRLSTAIPGFSYADFATTNGADLAFFTPEGRPLPYEIDEWNVGGESLVWVKLPEMKNGTKFVAAWGASVDAESSPRQDEEGVASIGRGGDTASTKMAHEVWREYAGVWHMNELNGTAFDSTEHHLDGIPSCGTNELADVSQMVAYENGVCGRARVNSPKSLTAGNFLEVPSYDALSIAGDFVVSGWFYGRDGCRNTRLWCRKKFFMDEDGWEVQVYGNDSGRLCTRGSGGRNITRDHDPNFYIPKIESGWVYVVVSYAGQKVVGYANGAPADTQWNDIPEATDNGLTFGIGGSGDNNGSFGGQYDEIRLRGGSLSADRIKADYDMIVNRKFLSYGVVAGGQEIRKNE